MREGFVPYYYNKIRWVRKRENPIQPCNLFSYWFLGRIFWDNYNFPKFLFPQILISSMGTQTKRVSPHYLFCTVSTIPLSHSNSQIINSTRLLVFFFPFFYTLFLFPKNKEFNLYTHKHKLYIGFYKYN